MVAVVVSSSLAICGWLSLHKTRQVAPITPVIDATGATHPRVAQQADFGKLPLYFIENRGQVDGQVAYYVQGQETQVYFAPQGLTFVRNVPVEQAQSSSAVMSVSLKREEPPVTSQYALKLDFVGSNPHVQPRGEELTPAIISYFKGNQDQWRTGLKTYQKVVYPDLWPGIDLIYSGDARRLKYTFVVKPGADPKQVQLAYRGATGLTVNAKGELIAETPVGPFADAAPYVYQEGATGLEEVQAAYSVDSQTHRYGFQLEEYDPTRPLVIDPVMFVYAGYIGGGKIDRGLSIAVDNTGNAYVTGWTFSTQSSFPDGDGFGALPGSDQTYNGNEFQPDAFVVKINAAGTALLYAGYIGGTGEDIGYGIAVDSQGSAYVVGSTTSDQGSFPEIMGPDLTYNGGLGLHDGDAFVAKVNATGTALVYAGYIGGAFSDHGYSIAVDSLGNAYITGETSSNENDFPDGDGFGVLPGPDRTRNNLDAFVAKINATGSALVYAGYIGGFGGTQTIGHGIAVDAAGNAYITGETTADQTSFPDGDGFGTVPGLDQTYNGGGDAFVAKVGVDGTALVYVGYIGGADDDKGHGIAVDSTGNAYVVGVTKSEESSFPDGDGFGTVPGLDRIHNSFDDVFVAKVNTNGTGLIYAGYIGGDDNDIGRSIAVDSMENAYVTGETESGPTFPVKEGPDLTPNGFRNHFPDVFVAKINADGTDLMYAGYTGGTTAGTGIAVDNTGNAYVVGSTGLVDGIGTLNGPDVTYNGQLDAFVAKISSDTPQPQPVLSISLTGTGTVTSNPIGINCPGDCVESYAQGTAVTLTPTPTAGFTFAGWSGNADCTDGQVTLDVNKSCTANFTSPPPLRTLSIAVTGDGTVTSNPTGINCPGDCQEDYQKDTVVTLTSTPTTGFTFAGWSGNADCTDGQVTLDVNKSCTATFTQPPIPKPDLTGSWLSRSRSCKTVNEQPKCTVKGKFKEENVGTLPAGKSKTQFFLSDDSIQSAGDLLLKTSSVAIVQPGKTKTLALSNALATGINAAGKYLIACVDSTQVVDELNENNCVASGPIP